METTRWTSGHRMTSEKKRAARAWSPYLHSNLQGCTERNQGCPHQPRFLALQPGSQPCSFPRSPRLEIKRKLNQFWGSGNLHLDLLPPPQFSWKLEDDWLRDASLNHPSSATEAMDSGHFTETQSMEVNCQRERVAACRFTDFQGGVHPAVAIIMALIPKAFEYSIISFKHEMNLFLNSQSYVCLSNHL